MKKLSMFLGAATLLAIPLAASAATTQANVSASVVSPIAIVKTADLAFGDVIPGTGETSTVVISSTGLRTTTSGATVTNTSGATPSAAVFTVSGDPYASFSVTLPSVDVDLTDGATHTLTVGTFTSDAATSGSAIGAAGSTKLSVGATLNLTNASVAGSYTGTFDVTVNYD